MTDLPFRSTMRVAGAACAAIAASSPTAAIRSPAMAIAWAIEKSAPTVMTLAFLRMTSAGRAVENVGGGEDGADADVCAVAGTPAPKVNAVLAVTFRKSRRGKRSSVIRSSLPPFHVGVPVDRGYRDLGATEMTAAHHSRRSLRPRSRHLHQSILDPDRRGRRDQAHSV